ncbi:ypt-1 [Symbiodinium sp. CCMP2592]|nr:ypt-1 [Symbiodinium sp. CCMP2592]
MANVAQPASSGPDYLFRVKLIGDYGVGKSSFILRFTDDKYSDGPIFDFICGIDFRSRTMSLDGKKAKMQLWDTAGQERFRTMAASYYKDAHGIIVAFDLTNRESFHNVRHWLEEIDKYAEPGISKLLAGNKCDMSNRAVTYDEAHELADELGLCYLETSAKSGHNVNEALAKMAKEIKDRGSMQVLPSATPPRMILGPGHGISATKCCQ